MSDNKSESFKIIESAAAKLGENFDAVVVIASTHEQGSFGSRWAYSGTGNYYTRLGLVREWLIREEERMRVELRKEMNPNDQP